jgi:uncharacterized membrane protein YccC
MALVDVLPVPPLQVVSKVGRTAKAGLSAVFGEESVEKGRTRYVDTLALGYAMFPVMPTLIPIQIALFVVLFIIFVFVFDFDIGRALILAYIGEVIVVFSFAQKLVDWSGRYFWGL